MPAPDPVAEAITRGLQTILAKEAPPEKPKPKGIAALLHRIKRLGEDGRGGR